MDDVNKKFEEFIKAIQDTEWKNEIRTIPEVFGIQYKEVYITKWLAYLLRQKEFGWVILNALLRIGGTDTQVEENDIEKVYTEYVFHSGRRIDILIETKDCLIGIENKIWSGEQENQTADYENSLKELSSEKKHIGIYLHPEQNRSKPGAGLFQNVTYTALYDELQQVKQSDETMPFAWMMFDQFMVYVKECLYMSDEKYTEMSESAKRFSRYADTIFTIEEIYKAEAERIIGWIAAQLRENTLYPIGNPLNQTYWQIVQDEKWQKIGFHFELVWEGYFIKKGVLGLHIHLERVDGKIAPEIRDLFHISDEKERGVKYPLDKTDIECDFSSEQLADETIKRIVEATKQGKFAEYAMLANEYIKKHYEEKKTE